MKPLGVDKYGEHSFRHKTHKGGCAICEGLEERAIYEAKFMPPSMRKAEKKRTKHRSRQNAKNFIRNQMRNISEG